MSLLLLFLLLFFLGITSLLYNSFLFASIFILSRSSTSIREQQLISNSFLRIHLHTHIILGYTVLYLVNTCIYVIFQVNTHYPRLKSLPFTYHAHAHFTIIQNHYHTRIIIVHNSLTFSIINHNYYLHNSFDIT